MICYQSETTHTFFGESERRVSAETTVVLKEEVGGDVVGVGEGKGGGIFASI